VSTDWKIFEGDDRNWDELLKHIGQMCVYQSANWARHKSSAGWIPIRVVKSTATSHIAIQCLVRRGPFGVAMAWAPGGFGGDLGLLTKGFSSSLKQLLSARFLYIRFGMMIDSTQEQIPLLVGAGFKKSRTSIGARQSMLLTTHTDEETMLSSASSNWKRNHKRSLRSTTAPYVWNNALPNQIEDAYRLMDEYKKVDGVKLQISASDIRSVQECFGSDLVLVRMDNEAGNVLSVRGALIQQSTAWDFIAVTTPEGRKTYSSHRTLVALAQECARRGCTILELGGIDPEKNKGVFDFKNGTGAQITTYLGEWEASTPKAFNKLATMLLKQRILK
jgi:lipid II:glycine glycyltransferase (peptidoglycan interpeptide bridge formation enzyme)